MLGVLLMCLGIVLVSTGGALVHGDFTLGLLLSSIGGVAIGWAHGMAADGE